MIVYVLLNQINGKIYVGQTQGTLAERWRDHIRNANRGSRFPIHCAIRKYGPGVFRVCPISEATSAIALDAMEKFFIQKYNSMVPSGYNRTAGGDGFQGAHTKESRARMSQSHQGKKRTAQERQKQGTTLKQFWASGWKNPGRTGRQNSTAHRQKQSVAAKKQWADPARRAVIMEGLRAQ